MSTPVQGITLSGGSGILVDIECHLSNNLPTIVIVGFANRAVGESKERIRGAFATSRILLPRKRITVNLAPADVPKVDSGLDLAIAVAILSAGGQINLKDGRRQAFIGELGLDGSTRAVRGIIGKLLAGRTKGIRTFYVPAGNLEQARLVPKVRLIPVADLGQLYGHLSGATDCQSVETHDGDGPVRIESAGRDEIGHGEVRLSDIVGQAQAKRALEIAAAGGHNIFFDGPPGTGKSMLAKALPGLLPPLEREEILEVTQLHSLTGHDYEQIVTGRPFRAPHHSASLVAMTGGGASLRPGEISLAHRGVLFLDELPEFNRETLEALRQPLENRTISVTRAHGTARYPASFIFVATANPCPCGYAGSGKACGCQESQINYCRNRLSGPILDRIDLYANVHEVDHDKLLTQKTDPEADTAVRSRVAGARAIQARRFITAGDAAGSKNGGPDYGPAATTTKLNADMTNADVKRFARIGQEARQILSRAAKQLDLSARAYMRTIKVARTIADLETSPDITAAHLAEALNYRPNLRPGPMPESTKV